MTDPSTVTPIADAILGHFRSLMRQVALWAESDFLGVDVTMSQAKCLFVASVHPGIRMSALAAQLRVGPSAASGLVDRLVEHGYLARQEDPADRRQQLITLTVAGRTAIERLREVSADHLAGLMASMSVTELEALCVGIAALEREAGRSLLLDPDPAPSHEGTPA